MSHRYGFGTRSIHAGEAPDPSTGAHGVPIYQNATFAFHSFEQLEASRAGQAPHFTYSPRGNPTVRCLELKMADLEGGEQAVATASGMAAISATLLHLLAGGGHLIASTDVYELTARFLREDLPACGATASFVDAADLDAVEAAITPNSRVLYVEPFSNPLLRVADLPALADLADRRGLLLVVDNTFLSPALLRPIEHGADIVLHSATKYLSGHGHVQGGFAVGRRDLIAPIAEKVIHLGGAMSPFAAWVLLAGIKTLPLRMARHGTNAGRLARLLANHPAVASVNYPGLPEHPDHAVARRLVGDGEDRFGGMLSLTLRGGRAAVGPFVNAMDLFAIATSLGECSSLVWPWAGCDLIRLSVGLEDIADLEADVLAGLDRVGTAVVAD